MSHFLLGVLLGFGEENARLFDRLCVIRNYKNSILLRSRSVEDEINQIENKLKYFHNPEDYKNPLIFVQLPQFLAHLESQETQHLKEKYSKQRKRICKTYRQGHFLEITLKQLTS